MGASRLESEVHAATGTMGAKYFTFCELGKIALRRGGADVSQVCVVLVAHEARITVRGRVEQSIQRLALPSSKAV